MELQSCSVLTEAFGPLVGLYVGYWDQVSSGVSGC